MKFVGHRVADRRLLRLIRKWLRAGVSEDGQWSRTTVGTPQGAVISPLLANLYLHHVLELWVQPWRKRSARGRVIGVRYADGFVMGLQYRDDAERLLHELRERFARFGLELHQAKTRLFEFGRYATANRARRGQGKPETFDLLGKLGTTVVGRSASCVGLVTTPRPAGRCPAAVKQTLAPREAEGLRIGRGDAQRVGEGSGTWTGLMSADRLLSGPALPAAATDGVDEPVPVAFVTPSWPGVPVSIFSGIFRGGP